MPFVLICSVEGVSISIRFAELLLSSLLVMCSERVVAFGFFLVPAFLGETVPVTLTTGAGFWANATAVMARAVSAAMAATRVLRKGGSSSGVLR